MPDGTGVLGSKLVVIEYAGGWSAQFVFPLMDHQGSVVSTADRTGFIMPFMNYSPWGELGTVDATQPYTARAPQGSPFGYTGREYDAETGLWQYRARYYQPRLGQFLSTDPIGMKDDPNLYMYVGLDPVNATDPTGMEVFLSTREVSPVIYGTWLGIPFVIAPAQYHMFLATHADYVGDPNARIFSWGPTPGTQGDAGSSNPKRLVQQFSGTELNSNDRRIWLSNEARNNGRTVRIDADDDVAAASAANVTGYRDYDAVPGDGANSNSGAYAAARDADRVSGTRPGSAPTPKPSVGTPGWDEQGRVERRCAVTGSRIPREC